MLDIAHLRWSAQTQSQLGVLQLSLEVEPQACLLYPATLDLVSDPDHADLLWMSISSDGKPNGSHANVTGRIKIQLSAPISQYQCTLKLDRPTVDVRLPLRSMQTPGPPATLAQDDHQLSAAEISRFQPSSLQCAFCQCGLVECPDETIFRPLPSSHYHELIEAYLCHPSGEFASKMVEINEKGFWPRVDYTKGQTLPSCAVFLVGETDLRVDAALATSDLQIKQPDCSTASSSWDPAYCKCGAMVGETNVRRLEHVDKSQKVLQQTLKLWKHSILLGRNDTSSLGYDPEVFAMTEMQSLAQAHSTRRFVLVDAQDENEGKGRVTLWVFQPDLWITNGRVALKVDPETGMVQFAGESTSSERLHVGKVLYKIDDARYQRPVGQNEATHVETLCYPRAINDAIIHSLKCSTRRFATAQRIMGDWTVGALRKPCCCCLKDVTA